MKDHSEFKQLISRYIDQECTPEEIRQVEDHLLACKSCQSFYKEIQQVSHAFDRWPEETFSPDLERKIHRTLLDENIKEGQKMKAKSPIFKASVGGGVIVSIILAFVMIQTYAQRGVQARFKNPGFTFGGGVYRRAFNETPVTRSHTTRLEEKGRFKHARESQYQFASKKEADQLAALPSQQGKLDNKPQSEVQKTQYEPYYLGTDYLVSKDKLALKKSAKGDEVGRAINVPENALMAAAGTTRSNIESKRTRTISGFQTMDYNPSMESPMSFRDEVAALQGNDNLRYPSDTWNTEEYHRIYENEFLEVTENALSTFSIDVDTASYSNIRRYLTSGQLPPSDAVRIEELINYFSYDYEKPKGKDPFSINVAASTCPWNTDHQLVRIGLQGKVLEEKEIPPSNLVFLIDVSGSMQPANKLPLLKKAYKMMAQQLSDNQRIAIVVYAGAAGKVLDSTPGSDKHTILNALDQLHAGGSTAGGAGIKLAYKIAKDNFIKGGNNRVILATDGDFNVGVSSTSEMTRIIEEKRKEGIFLTVLGFGMGNYKDGRLEQIADKGNGNYYYIDTEKEAKKVLVSELGSTLFTIAKDVKIQVEFNPSAVKAYRLVGYENRILAKEDFNDDTKDAGELGAGHTVTALYEIVPADSKESFGDVDDLVYQKSKVVESSDLMTVKLRYKNPDEDKSKLIQRAVTIDEIEDSLADEFKFAAAVAEFGLILRDSKYKGKANYEHVLTSAKESKGEDKYSYRAEFIELVEKARNLDTRPETPGIQFK